MGFAEHTLWNRWSNSELQRRHKGNGKKSRQKTKTKANPKQLRVGQQKYFYEIRRVPKEIVLIINHRAIVYLCCLEQREIFRGIEAADLPVVLTACQQRQTGLEEKSTEERACYNQGFVQ